MIILIPKSIAQIKDRLIGVCAFALLQFIIGGFIGAVTVSFFTEPLSWAELLAIPAGIVGWLILSYSRRKLFSPDTLDPDDLNPIGMRGFSGWIVFLLLALSLVGGFAAAGIITWDNYRLRQQAQRTLPNQVPDSGSPAPQNKQLTARHFQLQAIFFAPPRSSAVINGRTVMIGDRFENCRVKDIDAKSVIIEDTDGRTNSLSLIR